MRVTIARPCHGSHSAAVATQVMTSNKESEGGNIILIRFSEKISKQGPQALKFFMMSQLTCCQGSSALFYAADLYMVGAIKEA